MGDGREGSRHRYFTQIVEGTRAEDGVGSKTKARKSGPLWVYVKTIGSLMETTAPIMEILWERLNNHNLAATTCSGIILHV